MRGWVIERCVDPKNAQSSAKRVGKLTALAVFVLMIIWLARSYSIISWRAHSSPSMVA